MAPSVLSIKAKDSKSFEMMKTFLKEDEIKSLEGLYTNDPLFIKLRQRAMTRKTYSDPNKMERFKKTKKKYHDKLLDDKKEFLKINPEEKSAKAITRQEIYHKTRYGTPDKDTVEELKKKRQDDIKRNRIEKNLLKIENYNYFVSTHESTNLRRYGTTDRNLILSIIKLEKKKKYLLKEKYSISPEEL